MSIETKSRIPRYVAELLVVFVGVWASLLAENYRQGRIERADERVSLERLLQDLSWDLRDMRGNLKRTVTGAEAAEWLVEHGDSRGVDRDSLSLYLSRLQNQSTLVPNASEYTSLKGAGRINIFHDPAFRQSVTQLYETYPFIAGIHAFDSETLVKAMEAIAPHVRVGLPGADDVFNPIEVSGDPDAILQNPIFLMNVALLASGRRFLQGQYNSTLRKIQNLQEAGQASLDAR